MKNDLSWKNNRHFEVSFLDGLNDIAFYEKTLDYVIRMLSRMDRPVKEIRLVENNETLQNITD